MIRALKRSAFVLADRLREFFIVIRLWLPQSQPAGKRRVVPVIASLTTYPPRIRFAWMAIETLIRQSVKPMKLILVLNEEEFPDKEIPRRIRLQLRRGLEILWVAHNGRSYDKLIPVRQAFPGETIVTFDDDKFFPSNILEQLYEASVHNPGAVIGSRGWVIRSDKGAISYGSNWFRAKPGAKGKNLLTPGGNGCLYPPESLDSAVDLLDTALKICPTADDIWFWGAVQKANSDLVCLGLNAHRPVSALNAGEALSRTNESDNDPQFQRTLDYWGIRESVMKSLDTSKVTDG